MKNVRLKTWWIVHICSIWQFVFAKLLKKMVAVCLMREREGPPAAAWCFCILPQRSRCFPRSPPQTSSVGSALLWWRCPRTGWYAGISTHQAVTDTITQHADTDFNQTENLKKEKEKKIAAVPQMPSWWWPCSLAACLLFLARVRDSLPEGSKRTQQMHWSTLQQNCTPSFI